MIKAALGYFIAAHIFFGLFLWCMTSHKPSDDIWFGVFCFLIFAIPAAVVLASCYINRKWRRIVEEDMGLRGSSNKHTGSMKSVYALGIIALAIFVVQSVSLYLWFPPPGNFWLIPLGVLAVTITLFALAMKSAKDEEAFQKTPPRLPNLLAMLTGEERVPRGFRNRINFWGDLTGIGWGMFLMQIGGMAWFFQRQGSPDLRLLGFNIGNGYFFLLSLSLLAYLSFVMFFAGIPRKRYWGMIFLGSAIMALNVFMVGYAQLWQYVDPEQFAVQFGLGFWYLLCFILCGVCGLWVFEPKGTASVGQDSCEDVS